MCSPVEVQGSIELRCPLVVHKKRKCSTKTEGGGGGGGGGRPFVPRDRMD